MNLTHLHALYLASTLLGTAVFSARAQGLLTPPGAPTPMFKTLEQVEPRTPISSLPVTLSQPGSYYLTTNLVGAAGLHGITITGPRITLDLMGFELRGVPGSLSGIFLNPATSPHIRNGNIVSWGQDGINGNNGGGGVIEELRVSSNTRYGISFNSGSQIRKCIVFSNGDVGLLLSNDVQVDDCVASGNGTHGIQAGTGSTIRRCLAVGNSAAGITGSGIDGLNIIECNAEYNSSGIATLGQTIVKDSFSRSNRVAGIAVGPGSLVVGCNASDNGTNGITVDFGCTVQGCITENNNGDGINARNGSSIINCSARLNAFDNIEVDGDCTVTGNACDNATSLLGAGIRVISADNRIENNNLTDNRTGLRIDSSGNYVANNTVRNNITNYAIVPGNQLNILLSQLPQFVPWPATIKVAGTLTGTRNTNGITIASDDVTIDLNDHSLVGVPGSHNGILVVGAHTNITVRNGSVSGWDLDGVDAATGANSQLRSVSASRNGGSGMLVGEGGLIVGCSARSNAFTGIVAGNGVRVADCSSARNATGISLGTGSTTAGSTAFENSGTGVAGGAGSLIQNCTSYSNGTNGISTLTGGQIMNCTCRGNSGNGISASSSAVVLNNNCSANVFAGIQVTGSGGRIDGNHCVGGQRSFLILGPDNLIVRNSAQGATVLAYDIALGNHDAARITSPGAAFTSASPWANFSF
jgi:parallel beta-helix repeat protein